MVVIHVKGELEDQQFLYESPSNSTIDAIISSISEISNLQSQIQTLRSRLLDDNHLKVICPEVVISLDRIISEAESYASKDQVLYKRALWPHILRDHIRAIEKEVKVAHSKGLVVDDMLQVFLAHSGQGDIQLWWAGKELAKGKKLSDYIGDNEKTKIIFKLKSGHVDQ